jgi:hypothetical protein
MDVIESWEDDKSSIYAIVKHTKKDQEKYKTKEYEAMYMVDNELHSFGGAVGFRIADFKTLLEAQQFLLKGIYVQDVFPDIWLEMVEVDYEPKPIEKYFQV